MGLQSSIVSVGRVRRNNAPKHFTCFDGGSLCCAVTCAYDMAVDEMGVVDGDGGDEGVDDEGLWSLPRWFICTQSSAR